MKKRHLLLLMASLVALVYFWPSKNREIRDNAAKPAGHSGHRSLKVIEEKIHLDKEKLAVASPAKIRAPEKSCWERIRDQYQMNPDYLERNHPRLDNVVGSWYYANSDANADVDEEESSPQGKFFLALAKSGLLAGVKIKQDEEQALILLEEVAVADPQNSAPLLYAAIIEYRRGNKTRAEELLNEASRKTYFESYLKDFTSALFYEVNTPSDLLAAQEIWSRVPVPDYVSLRKLLEGSQQPNIAQQLVNDGLRVDRERMADMSWIPIEYSVGKKLLDSYGVGAKIPDYRDLLLKHPSALEENGDRMVTKLDSTCDLESIRGEVERVKSYFKY